MNTDSDGDGLDDGDEINVYGTNPATADTDDDGIDDGVDTFPCTSNVWFVITTTNGQYYQRLLPDCGPNAPEVTIEDWSWTVTGQAPTADSVVLDVRVNGYVDDYIKVDTHSVDPGQGPRTYIHRHVTNEIANLQSRQFSINLVDWPDPTHSGPNEVRLGTSETDKFMVEWDWGVPMALTGPEYVCVDDTAQFVATGAGGGPYAWSVDTDPATPAATIDPASGLLTGLAPGIATVIATVGDVYAVSQAVNVVQIDFLTGDGNTPASSLKIGKWENAFWSTITTNGEAVTTNVFVRDNFIDLDTDRFKLRLIDTSKAGQEFVPIALSTISDEPDQCDDSTGLFLYETGDNSGVFISTNLLLVADDIDDDFNNGLVVPQDDVAYDRTHKIGVGGMVHLQYPPGEEIWAQKEIQVPQDGTIHVIPIILKVDANDETGVISTSAVKQQLEIAQKRFFQIGINLTWEAPEVCNPPVGVDLSDGLRVRTNEFSHFLADEAKALIAGVGTVGNTQDIHLIYVNNIRVSSNKYVGATTVSDYWYTSPSEQPYHYNIIIRAFNDSEQLGYAISHEVGHALGIEMHASEPWRVMHESVFSQGIVSSRRFVLEEETSMKTNSHVQQVQ